MLNVSENTEALIVATGTTLEFIAGGIATSPLPNEVKLVVAPLLALIGGAILMFWKTAVNVGKKP